MNKKTLMKILTSTLAVVVAIVIGFIVFSPPKASVDVSTSQPTPPPPAVPKTTKISLLAVGDNLIHENIYDQAYKRGDGKKYDFKLAYNNIEKYISGKDIKFINQETLICNDMFPPSAYPSFNSPNDLGDHMVSLGFNAFSQANNHVLDKGIKGLNACLDYWDTKKTSSLVHFGAYRNQQDYENIRTLTINNIKFSFVAYTEHTNGLKLAAGADNIVVYTSDTARMKEQIQKAKSISDFVIVTPHWGTENSQVVNPAQKQLATQFADWGADLVIGTHPHVLQDIEFVKSTDGTREILVAYSLGNFISTQTIAANLVGGMMDLELEFNNETKEYKWTKTKLIPTVTWFGAGGNDVKVMSFADYTPELAATHGCKAYDNRASYDYMKQVFESVIDPRFL